MSKKQLKEVLEEQAFWQYYANLMGWTLLGWTYKQSAHFFRPDNTSVYIGGHGNIKASELDAVTSRADDLIKKLAEALKYLVDDAERALRLSVRKFGDEELSEWRQVVQSAEQYLGGKND